MKKILIFFIIISLGLVVYFSFKRINSNEIKNTIESIYNEKKLNNEIGICDEDGIFFNGIKGLFKNKEKVSLNLNKNNFFNFVDNLKDSISKNIHKKEEIKKISKIYYNYYDLKIVNFINNNIIKKDNGINLDISIKKSRIFTIGKKNYIVNKFWKDQKNNFFIVIFFDGKLRNEIYIKYNKMSGGYVIKYKNKIMDIGMDHEYYNSIDSLFTKGYEKECFLMKFK